MAWELRIIAARVAGMITIRQAARRRRDHRHFIKHIVQTDEFGHRVCVADPADDGTGFMTFVLNCLQPREEDNDSLSADRLEKLRKDITKFLFCRCKPPVIFSQMPDIQEAPESAEADGDYVPAESDLESSSSSSGEDGAAGSDGWLSDGSGIVIESASDSD